MRLESNRTVGLIVLAVLVGHASLVVLEGPSARTDVVQVMILDALTPVEKLVAWGSNGIATVWNGYIHLRGTHEENERLREENAELRMALSRNREQLSEADRLRRFLGMGAEIYGERVASRVIGRDPTLIRQTLTIDKGTVHGVQVNSAVITPEGIAGRVIEVAHYSAIVQLLSDPASAVGVIVDSSRAQGIVQGWNDGMVRLEHVDDSAALAVGDELITSGTDQIYPKGLPVGRIVAVGRPEELLKTASVEPAVDLGKLEEVLVLTSRSVTGVPPGSLEPPIPGSY
jgi:rod shape-determining protein MreC